MNPLPRLRIGHATDREARTGCTVLLGPFRGGFHVLGMATGTRELDALTPLHVTPRADALLLTGGSAFGLAAADGVAAWLEQRGQGFPTPAGLVPIVPAAVIYDLAVGSADRRPDAAMGRRACESAREDDEQEGAIGAGTGATVGKILGPSGAMPSGIGRFSARYGAYTFLALAVVNALGDVLDAGGRIVAGARQPDGTFLDTRRWLREGAHEAAFASRPGGNTTLAVVVTDAPMTKVALAGLARNASAALPRRIAPVGTLLDGDLVFALSVAEEERRLELGEQLGFGEVAAFILENAIERAVLAGRV